jgi:hypothetical protein
MINMQGERGNPFDITQFAARGEKKLLRQHKGRFN